MGRYTVEHAKNVGRTKNANKGNMTIVKKVW